MATSKMERSSKEKKPKTLSSFSAPPSSHEPSSAVSVGMVPDWSGFQAYSPMPPHGFVASSPQPHPYMWGVQHMMPPYGTPPHPYVAMYPPGGIYAHPSIPPGSYPYSPYAMPSPNGMTEASGNTTGGTESDAKQSDVKDKVPIKRSRGSLGSLNMITGKTCNGAYSKSGESASNGSSEGSDVNSQNDSGSGQDEKDASENGGATYGSRNGSVGTPLLPVSQTVPMTAAGVPGPTTNLNIGMDYWGAPTSAPIHGMHGNVSTPVCGVVAPGSRNGGHSQPWLQDVREIKRQRRKQSNRESARRSRLRKQTECDEVSRRAELLNEENISLRAEINLLKSRCEELTDENTSLKDQLLLFPPLEGISMDKEDQEPETNQTVLAETKVNTKHEK